MTSPTSPVDQSKLDELVELFGALEDVKELFDEFFEELPPRIQSLRAGVAGASCSEVDHAAHAIKGSSASLGAIGVESVARTLEAQARNESLDGADQLVDQLEQELASLRQWLSENGLLGS